MNYIKALMVVLLLPLILFTSCESDNDPSPVDGAPNVTSTNPLSNALDVSRSKTVSIVFNEAMDPSSINSTTLTLKQGSTSITGEVAYAGTTATFTPAINLSAAKIYTVTITTGAKNLAGIALTSNTTWNFTTGATAEILVVVNLGSAGDYVILAKTAINNSSTSAIKGNLGLSPAATTFITGLALVDFTGYATSSQVTGNVYAADMADPTPVNLTTAVNNMTTAYNDAAGRPSPDFVELGSGNIGGMTLTSGLYKWSSTVTIPTDLTLTGSATDVWIFQIDGNLTQSAATAITLNGGALAKNIFWQVAGEATFGTTSHFEGVILSMTGITFQTGATMNGSALAQTAVILDSNSITMVE
ncbi:ice-binding family protein [Reichenbachiella ulvae]|uniref:Ice-binding family protein n=1 Tax=Reichenbachiella ulvae TaxID=2980104 RepID=A0ABT3CQQ9_9BACT|nr:ice-binding family protein [Reichenbachiella ulvae]MCV9385979.1 ice-binding family protein [Reichenbachiella ulvae]